MPFRIGGPELLIVLVLAVLLFGVGRVGKLGAELGSGIKAFRQSIKGEEEKKQEEKEKL